MKRIEPIFNQILNKRMEVFAKENGLGTIKIVFGYYYVENFEKSSITIFTKGTENIVYESEDISDANWLKMLLNNVDIENIVLTPLIKWEDITLASENIYGCNYDILSDEDLAELESKTSFEYEDEIKEIYEECKSEISKDDFKIQISNLTLKEFDKLNSMKRKIEEYILELAKE